MMNLLRLLPVLVLVTVADVAIAQAADAARQTISAKVLEGARREAAKETPYIMEYKVIDYPGGEVPEGTGVCTDLVVRAFRHAGIDLQKEVHTDMKARPAAYPKIWDNKNIDRNIDHRRCPNLVAWFKKHGESLPTALDEATLQKHCQPGDVVFYVREGATHPWHVGIVSDRKADDGMPLIVDSFPPHTSESHRLDAFAPVHSHFRVTKLP